MWRRPACQTLSKAFDISSATAQVAPDLLKALAILSDTTVRRSAVDRKDLKPYWKSEKRPHFSWWPTILSITSLSKTLLTTEWRLTEPGPNLDFLCVWQSDAASFCENYTKLYFDAKHVEKGLNKGLWNFWCPFFLKGPF